MALLTKRINGLTEFFRTQVKDPQSRRVLMILVGQRHRLLEYLQRTDVERYLRLVERLGLPR